MVVIFKLQTQIKVLYSRPIFEKYKFQVYFIISSNGSPEAELQVKITLHNIIFKNTSKQAYTQENIKNI